RFAEKLLLTNCYIPIERTVVPNVINDLIESNCIDHFAKLSEDLYGNALLANHCSNVGILLEDYHNLMHNTVAAHEISKSEKFNFSALFQYFESSYPEIQHLAIDVAADLIDRNRDKDIQSLFHETNGVKILLDFSKWNDLHIKILNVLRFAAENPVVVDELIDSGSIPQILNYIKHTENPKLFVKALKILVHVANTFKGRKVILWLFKYGTVELFGVQAVLLLKFPIFEVEVLTSQRLNFDAIDTICLLSTYPFVNEFKTACCKLLPALCLEESGRHYFLKAKGSQRIFALITACLFSFSKKHYTLINKLIQAISTETAAKYLVKNKYLLYMLNNRLSSKTIPLWDTCIDILLKNAWLESKFDRLQCDPMKDSNEGRLFDACLDENNEDYETKLIKPDFIVNLMDTPGDLIPNGSPCSKLYILLKQ
ncbi:hypothetical protein ALC57_12215, partial [Trachymyrmex cornetzi]